MTYILLVVIVAILAGAGAYFVFTNKNATPAPDPIACTQEARQCPDGSYVGRTGKNCEFAPCPDIEPTPGHDTTGKTCAGPSDTSCGTGYSCISKCGPPVAREGDPPPGYFCQIKGYIQICPICLAKNTLIDTPIGQVPVQDLRIGAPVWTVNKSGGRVSGVVIKVSKTPVPATHKVVELVLSDGRKLLASPGHPTVTANQTLGDLVANDVYDEVKVLRAKLIPYTQSYTYDILVSGETSFYFADGILLASTLH